MCYHCKELLENHNKLVLPRGLPVCHFPQLQEINLNQQAEVFEPRENRKILASAHIILHIGIYPAINEGIPSSPRVIT